MAAFKQTKNWRFFSLAFDDDSLQNRRKALMSYHHQLKNVCGCVCIWGKLDHHHINPTRFTDFYFCTKNVTRLCVK